MKNNNEMGSRHGYVDHFLKLRCAGDVLNVTGPMNNAMKEISEAMSIMKHVKRIVIPDPMKYQLVDFCSGNALVPITAAFVLPLNFTIAVDKRPNKAPFTRQGVVDRFVYLKADVYTLGLSSPEIPPTILTCVHGCGGLAKVTIEAFLDGPQVKHLIMMPCCEGKLPEIDIPSFFRQKLTSYDMWCYGLYETIQQSSKVKYSNMIEDLNVISPKRTLIIASKE